MGRTNRVSRVLDATPPTTTVASGRCTSEPTPVESSIGIKPSAAIAAVISTGHRQILAGHVKRCDAANQGQRHIEHDQQRLSNEVEGEVEQQKNQAERERRHDHQALLCPLLVFELPAENDGVAGGQIDLLRDAPAQFGDQPAHIAPPTLD